MLVQVKLIFLTYLSDNEPLRPARTMAAFRHVKRFLRQSQGIAKSLHQLGDQKLSFCGSGFLYFRFHSFYITDLTVL